MSCLFTYMTAHKHPDLVEPSLPRLRACSSLMCLRARFFHVHSCLGKMGEWFALNGTQTTSKSGRLITRYLGKLSAIDHSVESISWIFRHAFSRSA